jgi:hypothetical protein
MSKQIYERFIGIEGKVDSAAKDVIYQLESKLETLVEEVENTDQEKQSAQIAIYANWLEAECRTIIKRHSPMFWISLDRRLPPWIGHPTKEFHAHDAHGLKTALFLKHGDRFIDDWYMATDGTIMFDFSDLDLVHLLVLYIYLREITETQARYRRVSKGEHLRVVNGEVTATLDPELHECMRLYDLRRSEYSNSLSPVGSGTMFEAREASPSPALRSDRTSTLIFSFNSEKDRVWTIPNLGRVHPNYLPYQLSLQCLFGLEPFEERIEVLTGLTLRQLRLCFVAVKNLICDLWDGPAQYTRVMRGAIFGSSDFLREELAERLEELFGAKSEPKNALEVMGLFCGLLSGGESLRGYDVLLRRGSGCLLQYGSNAMLDISLHHALLNDVLMDVQLDSEMRRIKGSNFEATVAERLLADVPAATYPIRPGLKLKRMGESNTFAEVDVYLQKAGYLFLIECKAYSVTREYFRGDIKPAQNRWNLMEKWLRVSDKRASEISRHPHGANYAIPDGITHIVPLVCSAFPEFFWNMEQQNYLIDRQMPRVCTYTELVQLLTSDRLQDIEKRPFTISLC